MSRTTPFNLFKPPIPEGAQTLEQLFAMGEQQERFLKPILSRINPTGRTPESIEANRVKVVEHCVKRLLVTDLLKMSIHSETFRDFCMQENNMSYWQTRLNKLIKSTEGFGPLPESKRSPFEKLLGMGLIREYILKWDNTNHHRHPEADKIVNATEILGIVEINHQSSAMRVLNAEQFSSMDCYEQTMRFTH